MLVLIAVTASACGATTRAGALCGAGGCAPPLVPRRGGPDDVCTCELNCRADEDCPAGQYCVLEPVPDALGHVCAPREEPLPEQTGHVEPAAVYLLGLAEPQEPEVPEPDVDAAQRAVARAAFARGAEAFEQGDWEQAHDAFHDAFSIAPLALVLYNLGVASVQTGRLVAADRLLRSFLERRASVRSPFRAEAVALLAGARERLSRIRVEIDGIGVYDTVFLDGAHLGALGALLLVDPGRHELVVGRRSEVISRVELQLEEGEERIVRVALPPSRQGAR